MLRVVKILAHRIRWDRAGLIGLALLLLLVVVISTPANRLRAHPQLLQQAVSQPESSIAVIVQKNGGGKDVELLIGRLGGTVTADLWLINALEATVPAKAVLVLAQSAGVRWISPGGPMVDRSSSADAGAPRVAGGRLLDAEPQ